MYYLFKLIKKKKRCTKSTMLIPVNDEILVTLHVDNYVYMEQILIA